MPPSTLRVLNLHVLPHFRTHATHQQRPCAHRPSIAFPTQSVPIWLQSRHWAGGGEHGGKRFPNMTAAPATSTNAVVCLVYTTVPLLPSGD